MNPEPESIVTKRGPGRPRVTERMTPVSTNLPPAYYERLTKLATKHDLPVATVIRRLLILRIPRD